jgi:hypothetical protein
MGLRRLPAQLQMNEQAVFASEQRNRALSGSGLHRACARV